MRAQGRRPKTIAGVLGAVALIALTGAALAAVTRARELDDAIDLFDRRFDDFHHATLEALAKPEVATTAREKRDERVRAAIAGIERASINGQSPDLWMNPTVLLGRVAVLISPPVAPDALSDAYKSYVTETQRQLDAQAQPDLRMAELASHLVWQQVATLRHGSAQSSGRAAAALALAAMLLGLGCAVSALRRPRAELPPQSIAEPDAAGTAIIAVAKNDVVVDATAEVAKVLRRAGEDSLRTPTVALFHASNAAAVQQFLADCRKRPREVESIDVRPAQAPNVWCRLELVSNRRKTDDRNIVRVRVTDVTEQHQSEEALKSSSEMLRTLTEVAPQAIAVEDKHGRLKLWNAASVRIFGWSAEDVLRGPNPSVPEDLRSDRENLRNQVLQGHSFPAMETTRVCKNGAVLQVSVSIAPLPDSKGRVWGFMEVLTDITERKVLEAQLLQAQKMEGIGRLAGGIAHDFNNLLTAVVGQADMLLRAPVVVESGNLPLDGKSGPTLRTGIEQIKLAADRASHMTSQLLAFSRNQVMQPTTMDINQTIVEMHEMLQRLIGEDIELLTIPGAGVHQIKADPTHITQVLINLAVNARDAMPNGGKVTIETANVDLDEVYARRRMAVVPGSYVMLAVTDTGCGMDKETQARVFEPFFTTKERGKGTGLGLATAYGVVKQSGGYIWCYSEEGHGTCFKVYLPAIKVDRQEVPPDRQPLPAADATETVLLVEDEEMVRALVRQVLTWYGYKVLEAHSGEAALRLAENHQGTIHVLVTDLVMPGMSGIEMAKRLVASSPNMRVLYMSGYTDHAVVRHHLLHPGIPFIQKPFAPDRLVHKVREVLNGPAPKPDQLAGPSEAIGAAAHSALTNRIH